MTTEQTITPAVAKELVRAQRLLLAKDADGQISTRKVTLSLGPDAKHFTTVLVDCNGDGVYGYFVHVTTDHGTERAKRTLYAGELETGTAECAVIAAIAALYSVALSVSNKPV